MPRMRTVLFFVAVLALVLVGADAATAQCSMCRTALAGSNSAFVRNFNIGVLVLLAPPVTIFCSIFVALRRYKGNDDNA